MTKRRSHIYFIDWERREYRINSDLVALHPSTYVSIVFYVADQTSSSIPRLPTAVKDQIHHGIPVHLVGVLIQGVINKLRLFKMTKEHAKVSHHMMESVHRFINEVDEQEGRLPPNLLVQLDNCWRKNKNRYLMVFLEFLVVWFVFDSIEVGLFPIGNTHSDIYETFSTTSRRLRTEATVAMDDVYTVVSKSYNEHTILSSLKQVANCSSVCDDSGCFNKISLITQFRFFKFTRSSNITTYVL